MTPRTSLLWATPLLLGGCFLFVDFPEKPAGGGAAATGGGVSNGAAAGGGGPPAGAGGMGGGTPDECPPAGAIGGTFVGADVRLTSLVVDGKVAYVTGVFDGNNVLRYRAQPNNQCQVSIEVNGGGARSFLAAIDLATYELSWWAVLADYAGLASDVEAVATGSDTLTVATTRDGGTTFGAPGTTHGFSWAHVAMTPVSVDPATREATLAFSDVHGCDADAVSGLSLAARGSGVVMAVSTGKGTCDTACGMLATNTLEDVLVFDLPGDLACSSAAVPFLHDSQPDLAPDVAVVGGTNLLLGFRGDDNKGYYKALGPTPSTTVSTDDMGGLATSAPLGRVHVAASTSRGLVVGTTKTAMAARTSSWRLFDAASQDYATASEITTADLASTLNIAVDGAASLPQGGFVMFGAVDEGAFAADAFGDPWALDVNGPDCSTTDPAAACGDAFLVLLADDASVVTGERWTAGGHQSLTNVVVSPGSELALTGVFRAGLSLGDVPIDVGAQTGAFLTVRPLPTPP